MLAIYEPLQANRPANLDVRFSATVEPTPFGRSAGPRFRCCLDDSLRAVYRSELETSMARAMIACPNTGKAIYTGMSFDKATFETSQLPNRSVLCPECGRAHIWNKQIAYLESEDDAHQP